jgi:hypothetical protein
MNEFISQNIIKKSQNIKKTTMNGALIRFRYQETEITAPSPTNVWHQQRLEGASRSL